MDLLGQLESLGKPVVNPGRAIEAAVDKYLASAKLAAAGLRTPPTLVCQTADAALAAFEQLGGDVVVKPLFGAEGRGITRLQDEALAQRAFGMLAGLGAVLYVQPFIAHDGYDLRVLVVGDDAWVMRRTNPLDWRTNVSRGARPSRSSRAPSGSSWHVARRWPSARRWPASTCCRLGTDDCTPSKSTPYPAGRRWPARSRSTSPAVSWTTWKHGFSPAGPAPRKDNRR